MICRWNREAEDYLLPDGTPCRVDDYGDPTQHCTSRRSCRNHVGWGELTCPSCIGATRSDLQAIESLMALMPTEAEEVGRVDSEPAVLAGPAADPVVLSWRRINVARANGGTIGDGIVERDPTHVLGTWQAMLSEDYGHDLPDRVTLSTAIPYLDRHLGRLAQDEEQDWRLFRTEVRKVREHLEAALRDSRQPTRGAPCRSCASPAPRLVLEHGHWCEDPECTRIHYDDDSGDRWVCPRDRDHWWGLDDYRRWVYADAKAGESPQVAAT